MAKRLSTLLCLLTLIVCSASAAKVNTEKTITVNGKTRKYILYVPNNVKENAPLVISLHGASGHDTDRSPFRTDVADSKGCIVLYPQGENQYFAIFGGSIPGWNSTGERNEEIDFFKAMIDEVAKSYTIDRNRIYCCGFSNGGMMTYAASSAASDIFAAFASISGFQLNEFHHRHTGYRPVPFMHIHGKADDFVKYSCTPIIRDNMVARNGCNPVPKVTTVSGKYTKYEYAAGEGGFPYIFYAMDGMGHNDYTSNTPEGSSALTMWNFMSQFKLDDACDKTLKWRLNIDTEGYEPKSHSWSYNTTKTRFLYGTAKQANNADNNVYPSLQFEAGNYYLEYEATGEETDSVTIKITNLNGRPILFTKIGQVGKKVKMAFSTTAYDEYKIMITKSTANVKFTNMEIHSCEEAAKDENCHNEGEVEETPAVQPIPADGLIEIPQTQGKEYDDFTRTSYVEGEGYNTYTATGDLQIAIKTMNVDVADCDYVIIKFAEPVAAGWRIAFWGNQDLAEIPAGSTEFKFVFADDTKGAVTNGVLAQICLMTFFGGYTSPLEAKVIGIYKHSTLTPTAVSGIKSNNASAVAYYSASGVKFNAPQRGLNIVKMSDGSTKKVMVK